ncbi:MAG TPA: hypothetical protein VLU25_10600 [Acidobacteriota bacterium]|nr:hypothetical protein [Acidobacteriota bacterium]
MMRKVLFLFLLAGGAMLAGIAVINLTGVWSLTYQGLLSGEEIPCVYQGTITVLPGSGGGNSTANLQSGPDACPDQMMADITSLVVDGFSVSGTLDGGQEFGMLEFQGQVDMGIPVEAEAGVKPRTAAANGLSVQGGYVVMAGPFSDTEGSFQAQREGDLSDIPLLSPVGLLGLAALMLSAALYLHFRKGLLSR